MRKHIIILMLLTAAFSGCSCEVSSVPDGGSDYRTYEVYNEKHELVQSFFNVEAISWDDSCIRMCIKGKDYYTFYVIPPGYSFVPNPSN